MKEKLNEINGLIDKEIVQRFWNLSYREQLGLIVMSFFVVSMIMLFSILLPAQARVITLEKEAVVLFKSLNEANLLADTLQNSVGVPKVTSIMDTVEKLAKLSKVRKYITRMKPLSTIGKERRSIVYMKKAPYSDVMRFIGQMANGGLSVVRMKMVAQKSPSIINVEIIITTLD